MELRRSTLSPKLDAAPVAASRCRLGESPLWSAWEGRVHWLDILGQSIWWWAADEKRAGRIEVDDLPCTLVECDNDGFLIANHDALLLLDSVDSVEVARRVAGPWSARVRANDGDVDASGALRLGTMDRAGADPVGALYRFGADLVGSVHKEAVTTSKRNRLGSESVAKMVDERTIDNVLEEPARSG